jgi:hypothetical protein
MRSILGLTVLLATALLPSLAAAQESCDLVSTLGTANGAPRLQAIAPGQKRVHFVKDAADRKGCPNDTAACQAKGYLVAGDRVVVTATRGAYACATFTGAGPNFSTTTGLLPLSALVDAPQGTDGNWAGNWRSGDEQEIDIKPAAGGAITLEGNASYGGDDPARVARGAVNMGQIGGTVTPANGKAAFSAGDNGDAAPYDAHPGDDTVCRVRLWRLGPYLVAADNLACGGMNVTFTGVYGREKPGK